MPWPSEKFEQFEVAIRTAAVLGRAAAGTIHHGRVLRIWVGENNVLRRHCMCPLSPKS